MSFFWGFAAVIALIAIFVIVPLVLHYIPRGGGAAATPVAVAGPTPLYKQPVAWVIAMAAVIAWFLFDRSMLLGLGVLIALSALALKGKGGIWAKIGLIVLGGALLLFGTRSPELLKKVQDGATGVVLEGNPVFSSTGGDTAPQPGKVAMPTHIVVEGTVAWKEQTKEGSIPINAWSEPTKLGIGCSIKFALVDGHKVEYQFYSTAWKAYQPGTSPNMDKVRYMVTKEGVTEVPYTITCS